MKTTNKFANVPETSCILLVISVTIYQLIYYYAYEYGTPMLAKSIEQYKRENKGKTNLPYSYPLHSLPSSDYSKLMNLSFTFHSLNPICENQEPFMLNIVYSAPKNFHKRKMVRRTWGAERKGKVTLFLLGETYDPKLTIKLLEENIAYQDMIQGSFLDSYKNLTYKHVTMLKFLIYHCPQAKYLLKADDDIYVNFPALLNFLKDVSLTGTRNFLFCPVNYAKVVRSFRGYESKWRLSFHEYPHKYHPTSCNGFFFVYSKNVAFELYREAQKAEYFWLEDVHITGHLAKKLRIGLVNARPFMINRKNMANIIQAEVVSPCPFFLTEPDLKQTEITWLNNFVSNCSSIVNS